jgi:hypothetical protein
VAPRPRRQHDRGRPGPPPSGRRRSSAGAAWIKLLLPAWESLPINYLLCCCWPALALCSPPVWITWKSAA